MNWKNEIIFVFFFCMFFIGYCHTGALDRLTDCTSLHILGQEGSSLSPCIFLDIPWNKHFVFQKQGIDRLLLVCVGRQGEKRRVITSVQSDSEFLNVSVTSPTTGKAYFSQNLMTFLWKQETHVFFFLFLNTFAIFNSL